MKDSAAHARGWFRKADSDLVTVRLLVENEGPFDTACFHSQQAAEKYLKGLLAFFGQPIPKTHDVEELQELCRSCTDTRDLDRMDLDMLTDYAVSGRYDFDFWPGSESAREALGIVEQIRNIVLASVSREAQP